jgi:hypothetical protein
MSTRQQVGWFDDQRQVLDALRICRERGIEVDDVVSPYPIHGLDEALGLRRTRLPWATLTGGVVGVSCGLWLQYWTSAANWPIDVGGKPFDSLPAFVPVAFELTVLCAGLCTVFGLLARCGLRPGARVRAERPRTSDDRIALVLAQRDASHDPRELRQVLIESGALEVVDEERES